MDPIQQKGTSMITVYSNLCNLFFLLKILNICTVLNFTKLLPLKFNQFLVRCKNYSLFWEIYSILMKKQHFHSTVIALIPFYLMRSTRWSISSTDVFHCAAGNSHTRHEWFNCRGARCKVQVHGCMVQCARARGLKISRLCRGGVEKLTQSPSAASRTRDDQFQLRPDEFHREVLGSF